MKEYNIEVDELMKLSFEEESYHLSIYDNPVIFYPYFNYRVVTDVFRYQHRFTDVLGPVINQNGIMAQLTDYDSIFKRFLDDYNKTKQFSLSESESLYYEAFINFVRSYPQMNVNDIVNIYKTSGTLYFYEFDDKADNLKIRIFSNGIQYLAEYRIEDINQFESYYKPYMGDDKYFQEKASSRVTLLDIRNIIDIPEELRKFIRNGVKKA